MDRLLTVVFFIVLPALAACPPAQDPRLDLEPPELVGTSLPEGEEISPTPTLELRFSEPLAPETVSTSTVVVVPFDALEPCTAGLPCVSGHCHRGRCQSDPVGASWLQDLAHPPLTAGRAALVAPFSVRLDSTGMVVTLTPLAALDPLRLHALLLSPAITDMAGNPLRGGPGEEGPPRPVFATAAAELARPALSLRSPPDRAAEVPLNLARVIVQSSKPVGGVQSGSLWLELATGERVPASVTPSTLCDGAACFELRPRQLLPPQQPIVVRASPSIRDSSGRPVLELQAGFTTGMSVDHTPPAAQALLVQEADGCVVVRLRTNEPADLIMIPSWSGAPATTVGSTAHEAAVAAPSVAPGAIGLLLQDVAGNRVALPPRAVAPTSPSVVITEVLANPAGPEPAQELVELQNVGPEPVDLAGWTLDDDDDGIGANELPGAVLQPGQLAVVVGHRFSLASAADPPPAATAVLVRLPTILGEGGLANSGERLVLRDPEGRLVSTYGNHYPTADKSFNGRSVERLAPTGCDVRANWRPNPEGRSTPGVAAAP